MSASARQVLVVVDHSAALASLRCWTSMPPLIRSVFSELRIAACWWRATARGAAGCQLRVLASKRSTFAVVPRFMSSPPTRRAPPSARAVSENPFLATASEPARWKRPGAMSSDGLVATGWSAVLESEGRADKAAPLRSETLLGQPVASVAASARAVAVPRVQFKASCRRKTHTCCSKSGPIRACRSASRPASCHLH